MKEIATPASLPDDILTRLDAVINGADYWRDIASIASECVKKSDLPKMQTYQAIAHRIACKPSAIRAWLRYENIFGNWLAEMPFHVSIEQLRLCLSEAKQCNVEPLAVMERRLDEGAKEYDGRLPPPAVWRAELSGKRDKRNPFISALDRACQSANTAWRKMPADLDAKDKLVLTRASKILDILAEKYCQ